MDEKQLHESIGRLYSELLVARDVINKLQKRVAELRPPHGPNVPKTVIPLRENMNMPPMTLPTNRMKKNAPE